MRATSEPASGSVGPNELRIGSCASGGSHRCFCSSSPARKTGAEPSVLATIETAMPAQPHESSSPISIPAKPVRPGPPYSSGRCTFISPTSCAFATTSAGCVACSSYSAAFGRISFTANSRASLRSAFCSSLSANEMPPVACSIAAAATDSPRALTDWSVNSVAAGLTPRNAVYARPVSVERLSGPLVTEETVEFEVTDPALRGVALLHELRRPRRVEFEPDDGAWRLTFPRPAGADRIEYLLEFTYRTGRVSVAADLTNPLRAPGPFGNKSVIEFPEYEQPEWVADDEAAPGTLRGLPLETLRLSQTLPTLLWSAADTDPARPLPLLLVHDGPEYADYSVLVRLLDHLVDFGEVPEMRAALLPPPGDRNEAYSASARYANALAADIVPAILAQAPSDRPLVLVGASLGALSALHVHFRNPGLPGG